MQNNVINATQAVAAGESPVSLFENPEFGSVRIITREDGEPLFCGKDVAICLGYSEPSKTVRVKVDDEDKGVSVLATPGGEQETIFINESGLYSLILGSKLDSAKKFKRWVTSEVLPSIRKTGTYSVPQKERMLPQSYADALRELAATVEENERLALENKHQARELEANKPKVQMYNDLMRSDGLITIAEMAKMMDMGTKTLYKHLRRMGILSLKNLPYQRFINDGSFSVKETPIADKRGRSRINIKILVAPKGQKLVHDHLEGAIANDMFI